MKNDALTKKASMSIRGLTKREIKDSMLEAGLVKVSPFVKTFVGQGLLVNYNVSDEGIMGKFINLDINYNDTKDATRLYNSIRNHIDEVSNEPRGLYSCNLFDKELKDSTEELFSKRKIIKSAIAKNSEKNYSMDIQRYVKILRHFRKNPGRIEENKKYVYSMHEKALKEYLFKGNIQYSKLLSKIGSMLDKFSPKFGGLEK